MTNALFNVARHQMATGSFNWYELDVVLTAWSGPYVFDETHAVAGNIAAAGGIHIARSLPNVAMGVTPEGIVQTAKYLLPLVSIGPPIVFLTLASVGATPSTDALIAYYDDGEGLPYTPKGLDVIVQPDWLSQRGWFRP
jgi:hypothetical protein